MRIGLLLLLLGLSALPVCAQPFTVNEYMGLGTVGQYAYLRGYIDGYGTAAVPPSTAATVMEPAAAARAVEFQRCTRGVTGDQLHAMVDQWSAAHPDDHNASVGTAILDSLLTACNSGIPMAR